MHVGIDLGTTNSLVAVMDDDGPRLIPNALGSVLTPSVVGLDASGKLLVGRAARELEVTRPDRCASVFKRHMGSEWSTKLGKRTFTAVELSSLVLRSLKEDAEAALGETVTDAVITVPAYFNEPQRKATMSAGRIAGLNVARILNEPTAAAMAYGLADQSAEKVCVVVDLGGGTFDVSVVELFEGTLEIRASAGEIFLGGEDFTRAMMARILSAHGMNYERVEMEQPQRLSRLRYECELAKRTLTERHEAMIRLPAADGTHADDLTAVAFTRDDLEQATASILNRIELPLRRALGDASLKRSDVDEVILVGGATRMPALVERVTNLFECEPHCSINPDEVVALGAAVQSALIDQHDRVEDLVVTDVAPFSLGVEITRDVGGLPRDGYFLPVIHRNTTIPVSRVERVATREPNQTMIRVAIYQGEGRMTKDNLLLGEFEVNGIPRSPAGQPVDIRFTYDLNGVLEVEATIVDTKRKATHIVTRHAHAMSETDVQLAVEAMHALKAHPREEAANRFLLRRAERVYQELPMRERQLLDGLLTGFEDVLELRDADAITRFRDELELFLSEFDPSDDDPAD